MLMHRDAVDVLAKYAHNVINIYEAMEMYIVHSAAYENEAVDSDATSTQKFVGPGEQSQKGRVCETSTTSS